MRTDNARQAKMLAWCLTAALVLLIGYLTLTPLPQMVAAPGSDKLQHFTAFAALALPLGWAYPRRVLPIVLAAALYGGLIELVQPYVGRHAEPLDAVADAAGALTGALLGCCLGLRRISRRAG